MKPTLLLLTLLLTLPLAARNERGARGQEHHNRREALKEQGAHLRLTTFEYDFGTVQRRGGDLEYRLRILNDGTSPLVITRVITSCSCLKCDFSKRPIAVGAEAELTLIYQPLKAEPGTFNKVVQILSNSTSGRELFTIRGNSIDNPKTDE